MNWIQALDNACRNWRLSCRRARHRLRKITIGGKQVATLVAYGEVEAATGRAHLIKGQKTELSLNYSSLPGAPHAQLIWAKVNDNYLRPSQPQRMPTL